MGLFSKRKDDTPQPGERDEPSVSVTMPTEPTPVPSPFPTTASAAAPAKRSGVSLPFGIEQAVGLLKSMPATAGSPKAYMAVVKKTLEAVGVSVEQIVADGERRSSEVVTEIGALQEEVHALEAAAAAKRKRVTDLQAELEEISSAQERFRGETSHVGLPSTTPASAAPTSDLGLVPRARPSQS